MLLYIGSKEEEGTLTENVFDDVEGEQKQSPASKAHSVAEARRPSALGFAASFLRS
jgi:hypothetical protein